MCSYDEETLDFHHLSVSEQLKSEWIAEFFLILLL